MWCVENVVELSVFTGAEVSPECSVRDFAQRTGTPGTNVPALCVDQPGMRSASVTFKTPPASTQTVQVLWNLPLLSLLTSESFWPFTESFQGSALPLGHGSVCMDEVVFPGYWKTQAGWFIKETSASYKLLRCHTSGSSSSNIRQQPGFLELDLIMSPSVVKVGICYCQYLLLLCHPAQQN